MFTPFYVIHFRFSSIQLPPLICILLSKSHFFPLQEGGRDSIEKYMKDLSQMMDGMLDLNRRNQLPDRERAICLKLLLRITLKVSIYFSSIVSCYIIPNSVQQFSSLSYHIISFQIIINFIISSYSYLLFHPYLSRRTHSMKLREIRLRAG